MYGEIGCSRMDYDVFTAATMRLFQNAIGITLTARYAVAGDRSERPSIRVTLGNLVQSSYVTDFLLFMF
jgi:hypothetical protein